MRKEAKHEWNAKPQWVEVLVLKTSLDQEGHLCLPKIWNSIEVNGSFWFCCCEQKLHSFERGRICVQILFSDPHFPWPGMSGTGSSQWGLSVMFSKGVMYKYSLNQETKVARSGDGKWPSYTDKKLLWKKACDCFFLIISIHYPSMMSIPIPKMQFFITVTGYYHHVTSEKIVCQTQIHGFVISDLVPVVVLSKNIKRLKNKQQKKPRKITGESITCSVWTRAEGF